MITHIWDDEIVVLRDKKTRSPGFFKDPTCDKLSASITVPDALPSRSISARIFPNGEFGVGFVPQRGISAKERKYDADRRYADQNAEIIADIEIDDTLPEGYKYTRRYVPATPPKLGIGAKSSQPRPRYGLKGITGYGRKMLRNAGTLLDKACQGQYNRRMVMGTVTLPSYSSDTMKRIAENWGDIVRVFFQRLKRIYARYRYGFYYASCTEIQPARLETHREVGLHLHFLFISIRLGRGKWVVGDNDIRRIWRAVIENYLGKDDKSVNPNYRREMVNKSSAAYIAKYMSKGGDQIREVMEEFGEEYLPKQWWSMDAGTRKAIQALTISSQGALAEKLLVVSRWGVTDYVRYIRCITLQVNPNDYAKAQGCPEELVLGYGGLLTNSGFQLFTSGNHFAPLSSLLPCTLGRDTKYFKKYNRSRLTTSTTTS